MQKPYSRAMRHTRSPFFDNEFAPLFKLRMWTILRTNIEAEWSIVRDATPTYKGCMFRSNSNGTCFMSWPSSERDITPILIHFHRTPLIVPEKGNQRVELLACKVWQDFSQLEVKRRKWNGNGLHWGNWDYIRNFPFYSICISKQTKIILRESGRC